MPGPDRTIAATAGTLRTPNRDAGAEPRPARRTGRGPSSGEIGCPWRFGAPQRDRPTRVLHPQDPREDLIDAAEQGVPFGFEAAGPDLRKHRDAARLDECLNPVPGHIQ